ncbi:hypothetical protein SCALM49S_04550 [Streptomyces californicus]
MQRPENQRMLFTILWTRISNLLITRWSWCTSLRTNLWTERSADKLHTRDLRRCGPQIVVSEISLNLCITRPAAKRFQGQGHRSRSRGPERVSPDREAGAYRTGDTSRRGQPPSAPFAFRSVRSPCRVFRFRKYRSTATQSKTRMRPSWKTGGGHASSSAASCRMRAGPTRLSPRPPAVRDLRDRHQLGRLLARFLPGGAGHSVILSQLISASANKCYGRSCQIQIDPGQSCEPLPGASHPTCLIQEE